MRLFPRTARHRLFAAVSAAALTMGALSVPVAQADDLEDRRERVEGRIDHADEDLDHSSSRMRRAMAALSSAQEALGAARAELDRTVVALGQARERDREMELELEQARDRLEQAQVDLSLGRSDLTEQREAVTEMVTSIYQEGDPHLQALTSMMNAEDPAELTWADEARDVVVGQETRAYDELRASEVLLEVREQQVAEAEQEVEVQREQAAVHLVETEELTQQAREARTAVAATVNARRDARNLAAAARQRDLRDLAQLRAQERKVKELILARARRAAARSRRADAQSSGGGGVTGSSGSVTGSSGGFTGSPGSFLGSPVPGGYVTSSYGYRTHPIYGYYSLHDGTDYGQGCGAPLVAAGSGRVISQNYSAVYGNRLYVSLGTVNGKNLTIVYNHAAGYNVGVGATVSRGQTIGYMGDSGWSTGCHLHFTVLVNGQPVEPMNWM